MSARVSKTLLLAEAVIFLVPVSALTLFYALVFLIPMYQAGVLGKEPWETHAVAVFTFLGLGLQLCGWRLVAAFLVDGRAGIRRAASFYFHAVSAGAALVVMSVLVLLAIQELELPDSITMLSVNYAALPALIPFLHIMVERWLSRRAGAAVLIRVRREIRGRKGPNVANL